MTSFVALLSVRVDALPSSIEVNPDSSFHKFIEILIRKFVFQRNPAYIIYSSPDDMLVSFRDVAVFKVQVPQSCLVAEDSRPCLAYSITVEAGRIFRQNNQCQGPYVYPA